MPTLSSSDPVIESRSFLDRHKKEVLAAFIVALLAVAAFGGYRLYSDHREKAAASLLAAAKTAGDFQKVISQYAETPASASAYLFLADRQRQERKFSDANSTLQSFLEKHPKHELTGTARLAMAANLESLGKRDEALAAYQRLAATEPKAFTAPTALMSTVHILKEKNQIEEARRVCETILTQYRESVVTMEATRELRSLKVPDSAKPAPPTPAATKSTPPPAVNVLPPAPVQSAAPSAAAPPVPSAPKPSVTPAKKP
jgi:predicted negative regulator of RcsB-dependent stress response